MKRMKTIRWAVWVVTNYGQPVFPTMNGTRKDAITNYGKSEFENGQAAGSLKVEKFFLERRPVA